VPTEVDKLTRASGDPQVKAAVSSCIATEMDGGMEQKQAIAACYSMARAKTGKELGRKE